MSGPAGLYSECVNVLAVTLALLSYLMRQPLWLLGQFLAVCAFALHASALNAGPIAVVQPIVVSGIVWAVKPDSPKAPSRWTVTIIPEEAPTLESSRSR